MRGYFVRPRQATYVFVYTKRYHMPNQIRFWLGEFWPKLQQISDVLSDWLSAISETRLFGIGNAIVGSSPVGHFRTRYVRQRTLDPGRYDVRPGD
jgi:hypothetical protein